MKRYLPLIIIALTAIGALASGVLLYRSKVAALVPKPMNASTSENGDTPSGAGEPHVRGIAKAQVTIEEFGDFQCPPCANLSNVLARVEKDYGEKLRVVFREFPLEMHNHAMAAAAVAEAAGLQGRFWEMHDLLYRTQTVWSKEQDVAPVFTSYAQSLTLDLPRFSTALAGAELRDRIRLDQERGKSLGVTATPTIFVNGRPLPPTAFDEGGLRAMIDAALRGEAFVPPASPSAKPLPVR